ncbi:P-loop containing nucleoside triphosphate hydrolase protein [Gongronella butleri]|nr:P-loop containing nucleoside triphosphate hydrolase protein [Gongronella butleri]
MDNTTRHERLAAIKQQVAALDEQIARLQASRQALRDEWQQLVDDHEQEKADAALASLPEYERSDAFPWSADVTLLARKHFGITSFRALQVPVMNAALDNQRDVFVVLPTGGGKSLCYQLPAMIENGFTLVVSPLVSLINDQVYHLREANVPCAMLTAASDKEEVKAVHDAMTSKGNGPRRFKLLYVTPEKIANSKRFMNKLSQAYDAGLLDRIIIDEAHCCSQQGHDFRPDYKKLNVLRSAFQTVKIMALTATCPWNVMEDVIRILGMVVPQKEGGTLVYSAPLYRPNLAYRVLDKPDKASELYQAMVDWILAHYRGKSGIVYCLTRKETSSIAGEIYKLSRGQIRCGIYHSDMTDEDKEETHQMWRRNEIQVVVATIAFGMGINHLQTRFIIHTTLPKSIEGYYQESGRAGRDGQHAECILYYRGNDVPRLASMSVSEVQGRDNLNAMVKYAQDYKTCRKILFEKYFYCNADQWQQQQADHLVNQTTPDQPCTICDNCTRDPATVTSVDITDDTVALIHLLRALKQMNQRVTMAKLISAWKGLGLRSLQVESLVKNHPLIRPVDKRFSMAELEIIINHLICKGFLQDDYHFTVYSSIVYIVEGYRAQRVFSGSNAAAPDGFSVTIRLPRATAATSANPRKRARLDVTREDDTIVLD